MAAFAFLVDKDRPAGFIRLPAVFGEMLVGDGLIEGAEEWRQGLKAAGYRP